MFSHYGTSPASASLQRDVGFLERIRQQEEEQTERESATDASSICFDQDDSDDDQSLPRSRARSQSSAQLRPTRLAPTREASTDLEPDQLYSELLPSSYKLNHNLPTETSPLLNSLENPKQNSAATEWAEARIILGYTFPVLGTHLLELSLNVVNVVSTGRIGKVELAAVALSSITVNVVALSVIAGFCAALDTLCTAQFTSSRPEKTSTYALRTAFILSLLMGPMITVLCNAERLLLLLHQDPAVAERSGLYLKIISFGLPGYAGFECLRRWLQSQGLMHAPTLALFVAAPLNICLNLLLVWGPPATRLGFIGAPIATAISMNMMFIVSLSYSYFLAPRRAWGGFSYEIFEDLGENLKLGLSGYLLVGSEWLSWEAVGLASSFLGTRTLAAQSILLTSASVFYQVPYSLSVASAVRIGNLIGSQRPDLARTSSRVSLAIAAAASLANSLLLIIFRNSWGGLFTQDPDVIALVASVIPLVAFFQLTDGVSGATGGILRGGSKATVGAITNFIAYYLIGLPAGMYLAFAHHWGLFGLWSGLSIALTVTAVTTTYIVWNMDWALQSERSRIRMGVDKRILVEGDC